MSTNIFTPMYKTRNYIEVVNISKEGRVTYNDNALKQQFQDNSKDVKIIEKYKKIHDHLKQAKEKLLVSVNGFVKTTEEKLDSYNKTNSDLIAKIYEWPQKFQDARKKYKTQLEEAEKQLANLKKTETENDERIEDQGENVQATTEQSIATMINQIKIIKSSLSGLKLMNFEMKSILSSQFGMMTAKTINNAISSFVVIYNRILNQIITEKEKERSFRKRMMNMVKDMKDHVYFGKSMEHRINDGKTKNGLQFWINKIKNVNETDKIEIETLATEILEQFEQAVDEASAALMKEQQELLVTLTKRSDLSGAYARELMNNFLAEAKNQLGKLDAIESVPEKLLMAGKLKICADLISEDDDAKDVWEVFGRASRSKLLASKGLKIAGKLVPKYTKLAVTCSVVGSVCSRGFISMCVLSIFMAGIPSILSGFAITISSLINIGIGSLVGYGLVKGGAYVEKKAREPAKELLQKHKIEGAALDDVLIEE